MSRVPIKKGSVETDSHIQGEGHVHMKTAVYVPGRRA